MNLIIAFYSEKAHKDVILPAAINTDYSTVLTANVFGLKHNLHVTLENLDGAWQFKQSDKYKIEKNGKAWDQCVLLPGQLLHLVAGEKKVTVAIRAAAQQFGGYTRFSLRRIRELWIGKNPSCDICYDNAIVSRDHAAIEFSGGNAVLRDHSTNGVFLNGSRLNGSAGLRFGDVISIFGLKLVFLGDVLAVNTSEVSVIFSRRMEQYTVVMPSRNPETEPAQDEQEQLFHRSPRKSVALYTDEEEIETPPQKQNANRKPAWMIIGPSFTMAIPMILGCGFMIVARNLTGTGISGAFMYVGLITAVASAIVGVIWAIINLNYSKEEEKETELLRLQKYGDYLMECSNRINEKYLHNRNALLTMYPDAATCCRYWRNTDELWTRNRSHEDFMSCRLGVGDIDFQVKINVQKKRFALIDDELSERPYEIQSSYSTLHQVPICIDLLKHRIIGVVGEGRDEIARLILTQLAANNCYTDVRIAVLADENAENKWHFAGWFPHLWSDERSQRYLGFGKQEVSEVCYALTQIFRSRAEAAEEYSTRRTVLPVQYVVFVQNTELLESEALSRYLLEQTADIGVTTILMAARYEDLPNTCDYIVESSSGFSGMYSMAQGSEAPQNIHMDMVSLQEAEQFARKISGIRVVENGSGSDLPDSITYFEMLGIHSLSELNVEDNWRKNRTYQTMQAMVGWKAGGSPCYLNIHEKFHGPHGLIAGTTGSGKSETLQTYILSLAVNYSPQDVGFFIIDFKGGGMANLFEGLPHMLGTISNLSGNQVHRAMVSIKSENLRRQRIFNEYGVNHIDAYNKLYKNGEALQPIPHMIIIIDEFAELKREEPDFMRELISVAQVGRSLGVHLILATQKPSGTVDDNIWSNTKFRLCLRVADKQDSKDMLHKVDAAYLTQAGRCYLQVGNDEIYELFQSGWSGAIYDAEETAGSGNYAALLENNGRAASTGGSARARKLAQRKLGWITQLITWCRATADVPSGERVNKLFQLLEENKANYADSTYNRRQLEQFIRLLEPYAQLSAEDAAAAMIAQFSKLHLKLPEQKEITQLDAIVEYLAEIAAQTGNTVDLKLWMPVLPETLLLDTIDQAKERFIPMQKINSAGADYTLSAVLGMVDDPQNQNQFPLTIDFMENGHLAVCGSVSSGKSTLLQTLGWSLARSYTPDMLQIYAIDYSSQMLSPLEPLPHVGGVVYEGEDDKLAKLFLMLTRTIQERKKLLRGGSFLQYIRVHGNTVPSVVLLLDGYAAFREKTENKYEDKLIELVRDGAGLGMFVCISAGGFGTGELQAKIADKMRQVICLEMESKYAYGDCLRTMRFDVLPESGVRGRGLAPCGDTILEFQTALAAEGDDYHRGELLRTECSKLAELWNGSCAPVIPEIPETPTWEIFTALPDYRSLCRNPRYLPVAYLQQDASVYSIDLAKTFCYLISGREKTGKSVFLRNVACAAKDSGAKVYLIDRIGEDGEKRTALFAGAEYINTTAQIFELMKVLIPLANERNTKLKALKERGYEAEELFEHMKEFPQVFVLFADLANFIDACSKPADGRAAIAPNVEVLIRKGAQLQLYFVGAVSIADMTAISVKPIYTGFVSERQGVHLGGELTKQKVISYKNMSFNEQTRIRKAGSGFVPSAEDAMNAAEIVIPMNKGILAATEKDAEKL